GRGKMGYITGKVQQPNVNDQLYENWELNNSIVMAWLINSMESHISRTYLFLRTAKAIDSVIKNYSDLENASQVFEIKNKLKDLRQGDLHYEADWKVLEGNQKFKKHLEKERLYEFLAGLNRELDEVRGRKLGYRPLPCIDDAFAEVRREASQRRVMLGEKKETPVICGGNKPIETMALTVKNNSDRFNGEQKNSQKSGRPWYNHCNRVGHTRDTCWDIH
ncbi:LOW QUALITY PROTEIN: UBN2_3 domain-containing protein, partial [Cephalotus follicularis]